MALEGPQLAYARADEALAQDTLKKALELARQLEELLEETRSTPFGASSGEGTTDPCARSTRMARAMAAGLVDELVALVRPARAVGVS